MKRNNIGNGGNGGRKIDYKIFGMTPRSTTMRNIFPQTNNIPITGQGTTKIEERPETISLDLNAVREAKARENQAPKSTTPKILFQPSEKQSPVAALIANLYADTRPATIKNNDFANLQYSFDVLKGETIPKTILKSKSQSAAKHNDEAERQVIRLLTKSRHTEEHDIAVPMAATPADLGDDIFAGAGSDYTVNATSSTLSLSARATKPKVLFTSSSAPIIQPALFDGDEDEEHGEVSEDIIEELKRRHADEYDECYKDGEFDLDYPVTTASSSASSRAGGKKRGKFESDLRKVTSLMEKSNNEREK